MNRSSRIFGAGLALACAAAAMLSLPGELLAQQEDGVNRELPAWQLQRFRPAPGTADYVTVFGTGIASHLEWNAGAFFNYADNPMLVGAIERRGVAYQAHLDAIGTLGLYDVAEIGLVVPWTIRQRGEDLGALWDDDSPPPHLSQMALNDLRLTGKYQLLSLDESLVGFSLVGSASLPLGDDTALAGDGGFGAELQAVGEYVFYETIRLAANAGFRYRSGSRQVKENILGNEVTWGLGVHSPFLTDNLDVLAELTGALGVQPAPEHLPGIRDGEVPAEILTALRYGFDRDWSLTGGFSAGLTDGIGSPNWRFFIGIDGKWATGGWLLVDYRNPNFEAHVDPCEGWDPDETVRRLRFEPSEDCPDPEPIGLHEREGAADLLDEPSSSGDWGPDESEEESGDNEGGATLRQGAIMITEDITFESGSDTIREQSHEILDDIATLLTRNDEIRLVRIEGHTDSVGPSEMNLELSEDRAESVRQYLIDAGVDGGRLQSLGYGESRPVGDNDTAVGRAQNRRVEFNIVEME